MAGTANSEPLAFANPSACSATANNPCMRATMINGITMMKMTVDGSVNITRSS